MMLHFYESPTMSTLNVHDDQNGGFLARMNVVHKMEKHHEIVDAENMHRVTHSVFQANSKIT